MSSFPTESLIAVITFLLGWGSGVVTAWAMYRDHDRRLANAEDIMANLFTVTNQTTKDVAVLFQMVRDVTMKGSV